MSYISFDFFNFLRSGHMVDFPTRRDCDKQFPKSVLGEGLPYLDDHEITFHYMYFKFYALRSWLTKAWISQFNFFYLYLLHFNLYQSDLSTCHHSLHKTHVLWGQQRSLGLWGRLKHAPKHDPDCRPTWCPSPRPLPWQSRPRDPTVSPHRRHLPRVIRASSHRSWQVNMRNNDTHLQTCGLAPSWNPGQLPHRSRKVNQWQILKPYWSWYIAGWLESTCQKIIYISVFCNQLSSCICTDW